MPEADETGPQFLTDWQAAEAAAVHHMKTLGFIDARATGAGSDGGIDAFSMEAAAQVKFYASAIGRPDIQRLRGAAHNYRLGLFYSTGGYTVEARAYANDAGIALYFMDPYGQCLPASDLAAVLIEPEQIEERRRHLEELQAARYRFALLAFELNLQLYAQFARSFPMDAEECARFLHVASGLADEVQDFRDAVQIRDFTRADVAFGGIQSRMAFLSWSAPFLTQDYAEIRDAVADRWSRDATVGAEGLLGRVHAGVAALEAFLKESLRGWEDLAPTGIKLDQLISVETTQLSGQLRIVATDESMLAPDLFAHLKDSVRSGIERARLDAKTSFEHVQQQLTDYRLKPSSSLVARMLRAEDMATRVLLQLDESSR